MLVLGPSASLRLCGETLALDTEQISSHIGVSAFQLCKRFLAGLKFFSKFGKPLFQLFFHAVPRAASSLSALLIK